MSPMRSWSRFRIMGSVCEGRAGCEGRAAGCRRIDAEALENVVAAAAAGLQPDLVQPEDVLVGMRVGSLAQLVQRIDHRLKLLGELAEHVAQDPASSP